MAQIEKFKSVFIVLIFGCLWWLGYRQYIADSEFWPISLASKFGTIDHSEWAVYYKSFFHALLKIPYFFSLSSVEHILLVKAAFSLLGIGIIILFYKLMQVIYKNTQVAIVLTIVLVVSNTFFSQYSRVRSDMLVCALALLSLLHLYHLSTKAKLKFKDYFLQIVLTRAMTLATPKSIYSILLLFVFSLVLFSDKKSWRRNIFDNFIMFLMPLIILLDVAFIFSLFGVEILNQAYASALKYFASKDFTTNTFLLRAIRYDILQAAMIIGYLISGFWLRKRSRSDFAIWILCGLTLVVVSFHNQKTPYFIASLLPLLLLGCGDVVKYILQRKRILAVCLVVLLANAAFFTEKKYWWFSNQHQIEKLNNLEKIVGQGTVFDGLGLLPRAKQIFAYIEPWSSDDSLRIVEKINASNPDFIFYHSRSVFLEPMISGLLAKNYKEVTGGVWAQNKELILTATESEIPLRYYFNFEPIDHAL